MVAIYKMEWGNGVVNVMVVAVVTIIVSCVIGVVAIVVCGPR